MRAGDLLDLTTAFSFSTGGSGNSMVLDLDAFLVPDSFPLLSVLPFAADICAVCGWDLVYSLDACLDDAPFGRIVTSIVGSI